eukprot:626993-Prymnesium_polylepis.1
MNGMLARHARCAAICCTRSGLHPSCSMRTATASHARALCAAPYVRASRHHAQTDSIRTAYVRARGGGAVRARCRPRTAFTGAVCSMAASVSGQGKWRVVCGPDRRPYPCLVPAPRA